MKRLFALLVLAGAAAVAWYVVTPPAAVRDLRAAAHAGDERALEERIAFDTVRANLRTDLRAWLTRAADGDDAITTFGAALGGLVADGLIDVFVSPAGVATLLRGRLPEPGGATEPSAREAREYRIDRTGPNTFLVRFQDGDGARPVLEFRRTRLHWRLVRIRIEDHPASG